MDAFKEPYWNLFQVLVWVSSGDRQLVQKASDGETDRGTFWQELVGPDDEKVLVETPTPPIEKVDFLVETAIRGGDGPGLQSAQDAVLAAAQESRITVYGLANGEGNPPRP